MKIGNMVTLGMIVIFIHGVIVGVLFEKLLELYRV